MKLSIRINFDEQESTNIEFLMKHLGYGSPQKMLRFLVTDKVAQIRKDQNKYGGKSSGEKKLNRAQRIAALEALPGEEIVQKLDELGALQEFRDTGYNKIYIVRDPQSGIKTVHMDNATTGMHDEWVWGTIISKLEKFI